MKLILIFSVNLYFCLLIFLSTISNYHCSSSTYCENPNKTVIIDKNVWPQEIWIVGDQGGSLWNYYNDWEGREGVWIIKTYFLTSSFYLYFYDHSLVEKDFDVFFSLKYKSNASAYLENVIIKDEGLKEKHDISITSSWNEILFSINTLEYDNHVKIVVPEENPSELKYFAIDSLSTTVCEATASTSTISTTVDKSTTELTKSTEEITSTISTTDDKSTNEFSKSTEEITSTVSTTDDKSTNEFSKSTEEITSTVSTTDDKSTNEFSKSTEEITSTVSTTDDKSTNEFSKSTEEITSTVSTTDIKSTIDFSKSSEEPTITSTTTFITNEPISSSTLSTYDDKESTTSKTTSFSTSTEFKFSDSSTVVTIITASDNDLSTSQVYTTPYFSENDKFNFDTIHIILVIITVTLSFGLIFTIVAHSFHYKRNIKATKQII